MAFSTGITCMPMPAPPGGTMGVIFSSGSIVMRSKNAATSGCSSIWLLRMFRNSALPGTNSGSTQRFSCLGFLPSRFSQLYSMMPVHAISVRSFSSGSRSILVSFINCSVVLGLRTPILSATSTISSVITPARPQYSGSSAVALRPMRFVIMLPSLRTFSRGASVRGILKSSLLSSRGKFVGLLPLISLMFLLSFFVAYRVLAAAQQKYRAAIITYLIQALFYRKMLDFSID